MPTVKNLEPEKIKKELKEAGFTDAIHLINSLQNLLNSEKDLTNKAISKLRIACREMTEFENQVLNETIERLKKNDPTKEYRR
jgi:hypothetical protein